MSLVIKTSIPINATPEKVWSILTDFKNYPQWNPFITQIEGELAINNKIKIKLEPPESNKMKFTPTIKTLTYNKEFSWLGHLFVPGLFDGNHSFFLQKSKGTTILLHEESFTGILVPLFKKQLLTNTKKGFELMNKALKELAETC